MEHFLWQAFVTLLVVIDPFAVLPLFLVLTRKDTIEVKQKIALKSCTIAMLILLTFAIGGDYLLDALSISEPAFRITGGFLLLLTAIDMVVAKSHSGFHSTTEEEKEASRRDDITVFPLAIPMIAGPGALTSIVVLMRQADNMPNGLYMSIGIVSMMVGVVLITYLCMISGDRLMKILGVTGTNVLTRVFGIILAALAIQSIINGVVLIVKGMMA